jgi:hypothetical protein
MAEEDEHPIEFQETSSVPAAVPEPGLNPDQLSDHVPIAVEIPPVVAEENKVELTESGELSIESHDLSPVKTAMP